MKTIVETLSEKEFVDLCIAAGLYEGLEAEELNGIYEDRNRFNKVVKKAAKILGLKTRKVGNRLIIVDQDGQAIPAVSPVTSGLAIQSGEAGKSTFFIPAGGDETKFGVKGSSVADVLADFEKQKKSVFESAEGDIANLNEKFELEGNGLYGPDIDTEEFNYYLRATIKAGEKGVPLLIWGAPGIGKTSIVKNVLKEFAGKKRLITKNLGQCQKDDFSLPAFERDTAGEITGVNEVPKTWLPMYKKTGDKAVDAIADNVANGGTKDGQVGEGGVIFFDEIARCAKDVQAVALTLIQDREMVGYTLGSKWAIVAASNREIDDINMDITLSKALGNRFQQFNFVPSFEAWKQWADKQKYIGDEVKSFLTFNKKYWYMMNPDDDTEKVFPSPRSWDNACKSFAMMSMGADEDGFSINDLPRKIVQKTLEANVGAAVATEFMTYWDLTRAVDINALNNVYTNPKAAPSLTKGNDGKAIRVDIKHYMVSKVLSQLDPNKMPEPKEMENFATWIATSKDESLAGAAISVLFDMYKNFKLMIGDPESKNIRGNEQTWNKYIRFVEILIEAMPGLDKDFDVDM